MIHTTWSTISRRIVILGLDIVAKAVHGIPIKIGSEVVPFEDLRMLVDFYAPELRGEVDDLAARFDDLTRVFGEVTMMEFKPCDTNAIVSEARRIDQKVREIDKVAKRKLAGYVEAIRA